MVTLTSFSTKIQANLFPIIEEEFGAMTDSHKRFVKVLELANVEKFVSQIFNVNGRPAINRCKVAKAFIAKIVMKIISNCVLIDRLKSDVTLRLLCGFKTSKDVPSESSFSRIFKEFTDSSLPHRIHEYLIKSFHGSQLIGHISRDSTAIEVSEKPIKKEKKIKNKKEKRKRGRPKKWEVILAKEQTRLEKQVSGNMDMNEMIEDLPKPCDVGSKKNSKGNVSTWIGYKLHIDSADGEIPISLILTSASTHDSQVAIPLAHITAGRVTSLYDLMDSAYDCPQILDTSRLLNHVPIIDHNKRRGEEKPMAPAQAVRYRVRTTAERVNSLMKEHYGACNITVKGHTKVFTHLMFGIVVLTVERLIAFHSETFVPEDS